MSKASEERKIALQMPTVHLGGTSKTELCRNYTEAVTAIRLAFESLDRTAPHGRDYRSSCDLLHAMNDHKERRKALCRVKDELVTMLAHILDNY